MSSEPNANGAFFVVRKDLIDSHAVQGYADMKGLTIGIPAHGTSVEYLVARALGNGGLTMSDVKLVVLNFPDTLAALGTGAIDMGYLPEPLATIAVQTVRPQMEGRVRHRAWLPDCSGRLLAHVRRPARPGDAVDDGLRSRNPRLQRRLCEEHQSLADRRSARRCAVHQAAALRHMGFAHIDPDGKLNVASMEELTRWYVEAGYLTDSADLSKAIDPTFAQAAVAKLGPVPLRTSPRARDGDNGHVW